MEDSDFQRLLSDKKRLEHILDSLAEGIIVHDSNKRIIFFNRAAEEATGYSRKEVLHRDCHEVFGGPFCGGRCSFLDGPPRSLEHLEYPLNILTKDGHSRRIEMSVNGMEEQGKNRVGVIASFRDVTDLISLKIQAGKLEGFAGIIGRDPKMLDIYAQIRELGTNDYPVLITGETGTGKELVAMAIHNESRRAGRPFVPISCAALPEGILESELFGHVRGAFTGAVRDKKGRFELAHTGTVFLDEIGELPKPLQAKLLRVLQEKTIEPVGSEKTFKVDVRLLSATNRDLKQEVREERFRDDLYYRINGVPIHLPPLRERKSDIPLLVRHFIREVQGAGDEPVGLSEDALAGLLQYPWPGNVRELQSAARFALLKSRGKLIRLHHLPQELRESAEDGLSRGRSGKLNLKRVQEALVQTAGNKARAARVLGVGRATLYRFLAEHPEAT